MSHRDGVRSEESIDAWKVEQFLRENIAGLPDGALEISQFSAGHSNLTYLLKVGAWEAVLRRPPLGPVAPKAHDMGRESSVLSRISEVFSLAPKPFVFSDDLSVLGSPFFVMERKRGVVVDRELPSCYEASKQTYQALSQAAVATLVSLHRIDVREEQLELLGKPEGFLERQVQGWIGRYHRAKTEDSQLSSDVEKWLLNHLPQSQDVTIVHNDFKFNNMLFDPADPSRVTAVLDWEMSTIGDPLVDVGATVAYWNEPGDLSGLASITATPDFYSRRDVIESYARQSGRDMSDIHYYVAFSFYKVGVICQQIYYRWKMGQTQDPRFAQFDKVVQGLMQSAAQLVGKGGQYL